MADAKPVLPLPPAPAAPVPDPVPVIVPAVDPAPVVAPAPEVVREVNFHFCLESSVAFGFFAAWVGFHALVVSLAYLFASCVLSCLAFSSCCLPHVVFGLVACRFW